MEILGRDIKGVKNLTAAKSHSKPSKPDCLVSLIVPVFNSEKYLPECILSLRNQTYGNIEIILVNDGSTDTSAEIIDTSAGLDDRIKVIHQQNRGVSAARNAALEIANGLYVSFVDADDWLSPYFVETFLDKAIEYSSDYILGRSIMPNIIPQKRDNFTCETWSRNKAIQELLYAEMKIGCWNKMYSRSLIHDQNLRFDGRFFMGEGLNFIVAAAQKSTKIIALSEPLYFYRMDNASSATASINVQKMKNALSAIDNIAIGLDRSQEKTQIALTYHRWHTAFFSLVAYQNDNAPVIEKPFYDSCLNYVKRNSLRLLLKANISKKRRALILANFISPIMTVRLYKLLRD